MTTTACAFDQTVATGRSALEIATITPGYAAVRAHRPLKGRLASRAALLGTSVLAGVFGMMAAEAVAQQYNLPGSGGFTDVSSSINVVTDAGAGNIRVILADGVQFVAAPGQYQLNPMTNQLQVATDVLLSAYTGGAPMMAQQSSQAMMATQALSAPPVYAANASLTLPGPQYAQAGFGAPTGMATYQPQAYTASQYSSQPSVVGGYQMQPSSANIAYNTPTMATMNQQATQYVPAYSAGAQMAGGGYGGGYGGGAATTFGGAHNAFGGQAGFGGFAPVPVTQAVPMAEVAAAPVAVSAASGGMFGLPSWALIGGGVAAAGAAVLAMGGLGGEGTTTTPATNSTATNYSVSQQAFLNDPAVQAALNGNSDDDDDDSDSSSSGSSGGSSGGSDDGITVDGGSDGSGSTDDNDDDSNDGATTTISAGSQNQSITGTTGDDTVTFAAAEDAEEFNSIDLASGDDTVVLQDMDSDVTPKDLNNVENVEVQVTASGNTLDMTNAGDDVESVTVDANDNTVTITNVDTIKSVAVSDAGANLVTIENIDSGNSVSLTESDNVEIGAGAVLELNVNEVNGSVEIETTTSLTVDVADGTDNAFALTATALTNLTVTGDGAITVNNDIGDSDLAAVTSFDGSAAGGPVNIAIDGTGVEDVDTGSAGDMVHIKGSHADATYDTNGGNDTVEIDDFGTSAVLNTGSGGDKIELDVELTSTNQQIDGGDGSDTLEVSVNVASGNFDNIETLEIGGGATAVDLELFDEELDTVEVETTSNVSLTKIGASHDIETVNGATVTIVSGTSDQATFIAAGDLTIANSSTVTAVEDLDLSFTSNSASTLTLTGTATEKLVIENADAAVALTGAAITSAASAVTSIDATALTTALTVGSAAGSGAGNISAISLGSGNDTAYIDGGQAGADIDMGDGDDTIDASSNNVAMDYRGGSGKDAIALDGTNNVQDDIVFAETGDFVIVTSGSTADLDTITGFDSGEDKIDLNALNLTGIDNGSSLADAYSIVSGGTADVAYYVTGGDTFVYVDLGSTVGAFELTSTSAVEADFNL